MLQPSPTSALLEGFTLSDVESLAQDNPSLRGYLQGYLAELRLQELLLGLEEVNYVEKIPDSAQVKGDFFVEYRSHLLTVEAKSFRSGSSRFNPLLDTWDATVQCKNPGSRSLSFADGRQVTASCVEERRFDVIAVCTYPVTGRWEFLFAPEFCLPRAEGKPGYLQGSFKVDPLTSTGFYEDPRLAFNLALLDLHESSAKIEY